MLTDPAFIRRLETLNLLAKKVLGGQLQANRQSTRKGSGITFADYAEYSLGDDHRAIDWRVYGRLEKLMIKMFEVEQEMTLHLLIDISPSMEAKFTYARQLAAALGYVALSNLDRVAVYVLNEGLETKLAPCHGRGRILPFLRTLENLELSGTDTRFNRATGEFQLRQRRRGMIVPVSDFFFPEGFEDGLKFLQWHNHEIFCMQVQHEDERRCEMKGEMELECVESGRRQRVTVTQHEARAYEQAVRDWNQELGRACARRGIGLVSTTPDVPFDDVIQRILRQGGLVS